jgi:hypothetical protein
MSDIDLAGVSRRCCGASRAGGLPWAFFAVTSERRAGVEGATAQSPRFRHAVDQIRPCDARPRRGARHHDLQRLVHEVLGVFPDGAVLLQFEKAAEEVLGMAHAVNGLIREERAK